MSVRPLLLALALASGAGCADPAPEAPEETGSLEAAVAAADTAAFAVVPLAPDVETEPAPVPMAAPEASFPATPTAPPSASRGTRPRPPEASAPPLAVARPVAAPADGRFALLVGVSDYPGTEDDLPSGDLDVAAMRALLVERYGYRPENVLTLTDREATRGALRRAVARHLGQARTTALLYFSGHGVRLNTNAGLPDAEREGRDEAVYLWADDRASGALVLDDEIGAWTDALGAEQVLIVLDACHSGTGARGATADAPPVKEVELEAVRAGLDGAAPWNAGEPIHGAAAEPARATVLLAAARDREPAYAGLPGEPSLFTATLARILRELPETTPLADAMRLVRDRVEEASEAYGRSHSPQLEGAGARSLADLLARDL